MSATFGIGSVISLYGNTPSLTGNVMLGSSALANATSNSTFNTAIGGLSGIQNTTAGSYNTIIGHGAKTGAITGYQTVIGAGAALTHLTTFPSVAVGYQATAASANVCMLGSSLSANRIVVVENGPHFNLHYNETFWIGKGIYSGAITYITVPALGFIDGLIMVIGNGMSGTTITALRLPTVSDIITAMMETVNGSALCCKICSYYSTTNISLTNMDPTYLTIKGPTTLVAPDYSIDCLFIQNTSTTATLYCTK